MKKKIRVYLDTSVISYLDQQDAPERMQETRELWNILATGKYEIVISSITLAEIAKCDKEKFMNLIYYISQLDYIEYDANNDDVDELAGLIVQEDILSPKSIEDASHIAAAILSESDIILSWNFKHLVNIKTINGVRKICFSRSFNKIIDIYSPNILLEKEDDGNE
ncbi:MAG: PIN domain-containing protein [Clostridia bacterium]|nr:PIN domain-containing protein [Clostridia bacterium]